MLELLAIAPEDGWAYVWSNGQIELVRPPYIKSNSTLVDESTVDKAIQQHGFHAIHQIFPHWAQLVNFLNEKVRESRRLRGQTIPEKGTGAQILKFAPVEILSSYLNRIESELLPTGDWEPAENLLHDMLNLDLVQQDHALLTRVSGLLSKTRDTRRAAALTRQNLAEAGVNISDKFPKLIAIYGLGLISYTRNVTISQQLFAIR